MQAANHPAARQHLAETMGHVNIDRTPLLVTRQKREAVVMISQADYKAFEEAAYLLRSPANLERLITSVNSLGGGKAEARQLIDEE